MRGRAIFDFPFHGMEWGHFRDFGPCGSRGRFGHGQRHCGHGISATDFGPHFHHRGHHHGPYHRPHNGHHHGAHFGSHHGHFHCARHGLGPHHGFDHEHHGFHHDSCNRSANRGHDNRTFGPHGAVGTHRCCGGRFGGRGGGRKQSDKDQNATDSRNDAVLVQRIVVEKGPRCYSV